MKYKTVCASLIGVLLAPVSVNADLGVEKVLVSDYHKQELTGKDAEIDIFCRIYGPSWKELKQDLMFEFIDDWKKDDIKKNYSLAKELFNCTLYEIAREELAEAIESEYSDEIPGC